MAMFEKAERQRTAKDLATLRQELSQELAALKRTQASLKERVDHLHEQQQALMAGVTGNSQTLKDSHAQVLDQAKRLDHLIACPQCGVVVDIANVSTTGGLFREAGKRCPLCERNTFIDDVPILIKKGSERK